MLKLVLIVGLVIVFAVVWYVIEKYADGMSH